MTYCVLQEERWKKDNILELFFRISPESAESELFPLPICSFLLLDFGFSSQALHYLEELAKAVTKHPYELDPDLAQVIYQAYR